MRRTLAIALVAAPAAGALASAAPAAAAAGPVGSARLQGRFQMAGRVTSASNVRGVHVGDRVARIWTFTPGCAVGACPTVTLARARGHGSDTVKLKRKGRGYYTGSSSFYAQLRCGSRVYTRGWLVPFRITVRITAAAASGGVVVATRLKASFLNRSRKNETPCVVPPGHDAAKYHGHLV